MKANAPSPSRRRPRPPGPLLARAPPRDRARRALRLEKGTRRRARATRRNAARFSSRRLLLPGTAPKDQRRAADVSGADLAVERKPQALVEEPARGQTEVSGHAAADAGELQARCVVVVTVVVVGDDLAARRALAAQRDPEADATEEQVLEVVGHLEAFEIVDATERVAGAEL